MTQTGDTGRSDSQFPFGLYSLWDSIDRSKRLDRQVCLCSGSDPGKTTYVGSGVYEKSGELITLLQQ